MKKLILLTLLALFTLGSIAQTLNRSPLSTTNHLNKDTITNSGTRLFTIQVINYDNVSIQANVLKISGTPAGNVLLMGSLDGITYEQIPSQRKDGRFGLDTLIVTNVSPIQTHTFVVPKLLHNFYGISYTGTGTMAASLQPYETQRPLFYHSQ